jgi:capsular polysaccharide biosynthesis protein
LEFFKQQETNMTKKQMGNNAMEIDLLDLAKVLLRRAWLIVIAAILAGVVSYGYTYRNVTPLYKASAMMYVNNSGITVGGTSFTISGSEISAAKTLVETYSVILKTRTTLEDVIEIDNLNYSYETLYNMVSSSAVNDTEIFQITVTSSSPTEAELIANTLADLLPEKISGIVAGSDVRVVDYAVVPANRISPSYTDSAAKGAFVGALLAVAYIVLRYLLDDKIHSEDYLTHTYPDVPLLAVVPSMSGKRGKTSDEGYRVSTPSQEQHHRAESAEHTEPAQKQAPKGEGQAPHKGTVKREKKEGV